MYIPLLCNTYSYNFPSDDDRITSSHTTSHSQSALGKYVALRTLTFSRCSLSLSLTLFAGDGVCRPTLPELLLLEIPVGKCVALHV